MSRNKFSTESQPPTPFERRLVGGAVIFILLVYALLALVQFSAM